MAEQIPDPFDDRLVLVFRKPIVIGDVTYSQVILTEPNGKQLIQAEGVAGEWNAVVTLIHIVGVIPMSVAEQIKQRDLTTAMNFFMRFVPAGDNESASGASASTTLPGT